MNSFHLSPSRFLLHRICFLRIVERADQDHTRTNCGPWGEWPSSNLNVEEGKSSNSLNEPDLAHPAKEWIREGSDEKTCRTTEPGFATLFLKRTNRSCILSGGVIGGRDLRTGELTIEMDDVVTFLNLLN